MIRVTITHPAAAAGATIQEFAHGALTVGRDSTNDIVLADSHVSVRHANVLVNDAGLTLFDRSGTAASILVNGDRVTHSVALGPDDVVDIAGFKLRFVSVPDESPAITALTCMLRREAGGLLPAATELPSDIPDRHAKLRDEINKESAVGPQVDWSTVAELGQGLLRQRVQDLRVAVYTAFALHHTRGAEGLALGLMVVDSLLEACWDALEPPRVRGRVMAIEWLLEHIIARIRDPHTARPDPDAWAVVGVASERLELRVRNRLGDQAPAFTAWTAALRQVELGPRTTRAAPCPAALDESHRPLKNRGDPTPPLPDRALPTAIGAPAPPSFDTPAVATVAEERHLEVALPRALVEQVGVPLYVLLRIPGTSTLLERLGRAGPHDWTAQDEKRSAMWVDYPLDPRGAPIPLSVVVTLQSDDFQFSEPRKRVRLSRGRDAPLLTFFVAPRRPGPVNLTVEIQIEDDVVGTENIWRVCLDRGSAAAAAAAAAFSSQSTPLRPLTRPPARRPHGSAEYHLHDLLLGLFSPEELHCWVRLHFPGWSAYLPTSGASLNEAAFALVDTGARHGRLDAAFFDALAAQFPRRGDQIARVRTEFAP